MSAQSRLSSALTDGGLALPNGPVLLLRPPAGYDIAGLPRDAICVDQSFRPDARAWEEAGFARSCDASGGTAIVVVPRSKALARDLIARAAGSARLVVVDGQKTDGIDSLYRECRKRLGALPSLAKAHGRLFWFPGTDAFADWRALAPSRGPHGFVTAPGVYSEGAVDAGSALLGAALPPKLPARMADLGAGWGYLAGPVLARDGVRSLDLIEAEALALDCARQNVTDPRARFLWEDVLTYRPDDPYDGIVMNPPFHAGRAADPGLGRSFIAAAAGMMPRHGKLWMVANRHLPYEAALRECFAHVEDLGGSPAFKLFHATRPLR